MCALVLNANGDRARFGAFGLPVIADPIAGFAGPLAGIEGIVVSAKRPLRLILSVSLLQRSVLLEVDSDCVAHL